MKSMDDGPTDDYERTDDGACFTISSRMSLKAQMS